MTTPPHDEKCHCGRIIKGKGESRYCPVGHHPAWEAHDDTCQCKCHGTTLSRGKTVLAECKHCTAHDDVEKRLQEIELFVASMPEKFTIYGEQEHMPKGTLCGNGYFDLAELDNLARLRSQIVPFLLEQLRSLQKQNREYREECKTLKGALQILNKNVILAIRRASRGIRNPSNPLLCLESVVEALPPLETLIGTTPKCDNCNNVCFKDYSEYVDIMLCEKCYKHGKQENSKAGTYTPLP